jgi:hypothetical protein
MLTLLLALLQAASAPEGPKSLWEMTLAGSDSRPVVHRACEAPPMSDAQYMASVDAMDPPGASCDAPVLKRTPQGWSRERVCRDQGRTVVIRASRTGDPDNDATFATVVEPQGGGRRWAVSTRLRRVGPCPGEPAEPAKGPVRCPTRGALACGR